MKHFRFLLIVAIAFGLLVAPVGCASVKAFFTSAQEIACSPPANVIAVAKAAAPLVAIAINMLVPGTEAYINIVTVEQAVDAILGGACVSLTELNALITWLQSDMAKSIQTKTAVKAAPMKAIAAIDPQALIDWRNAIFN